MYEFSPLPNFRGYVIKLGNVFSFLFVNLICCRTAKCTLFSASINLATSIINNSYLTASIIHYITTSSLRYLTIT